MEDVRIIDMTPDTMAVYGACGYRDVKKHVELRRKIEWFAEYHPKGLRIKGLISGTGECQGLLEYMPGIHAFRPVDAEGWMFIQCVFVGFRKEFKGKGYASAMIDECVREARAAGMRGVSVVTRKGSFMASGDLFARNGFHVADAAKPDFELLALNFSEKGPEPRFKAVVNGGLEKYGRGLTVMRSPQCPYTEKNVKAIAASAEKLKLETRLVDLTDAAAVQSCPNPFGTFCIIYNGRIVSHHPISNARFENIMRKYL